MYMYMYMYCFVFVIMYMYIILMFRNFIVGSLTESLQEIIRVLQLTSPTDEPGITIVEVLYNGTSI